MSQPTLDKFQQCLPVFSVLADDNRQKILCLLDRERELNVNQLTEQLHLSRPAVSHHLKLMLDKQLIKVNQIGKERYYSLNLQPTLASLKELVALLEQDEAARQA
ncbi:metalloregulator ArsR/SmtB family transcription factor [Uruburuella testudinis]|uniref:Metalloregulator ArsR/SmtB family transcription factor n=1 Tax=Uruburuella testudinis TaxID=1282863 RepID=A0ABY4DWM4_9NEIS|nr:metalloregulator ArsR/SmtB family transcription factor [Uruburuella testudinis]UOO83040.1 metalloregulator ArsR/SmtB family transcription factor [Uruburuella testudinis]